MCIYFPFLPFCCRLLPFLLGAPFSIFSAAGSFLSGLEGAPLFPPGFFLLISLLVAGCCFLLLLSLLEDNDLFEEEVVDSVGEGAIPNGTLGEGGSRKFDDLLRF